MAYFRQFGDPPSGTFSYLLACDRTATAAIVDPVAGHEPLYLGVLGELSLHLAWVLDTHLHADHISAADALRQQTGARVAVGRQTGIEEADRWLADGDSLAVGDLSIAALATPGHTPGCLTYRWEDRLFTGDSLLIGGSGGIDEPGGNGVVLFDSVTRRLLSLADETLVYPGHGRDHHWVSCIGQERQSNPCFHGVCRDRFVAIKAAHREPMPAIAATALAANRRCGRLPATEPATKDFTGTNRTAPSGASGDYSSWRGE